MCIFYTRSVVDESLLKRTPDDLIFYEEAIWPSVKTWIIRITRKHSREADI